MTPHPSIFRATGVVPLVALLTVLLVTVPAPSATVAAGAAVSLPPVPPDGHAVRESFHYRWQLSKFGGFLAGLFLPSRGDGSLTLSEGPGGGLRSDLLITSPEGEDHEYFHYGAEIDPTSGRTLEASSSYTWRGETSREESEIDASGVVDVASAIWRLRQDPPTKPLHMRVWSDGKTYPVVVAPMESEERTLPDGRSVNVRLYEVRGIDVEGERFWKGEMDLWLADDEAATPMEIVIGRRFVAVQMTLTGSEPT